MPRRPLNPDPAERGSAMLEFALTASIVFTLIFGVMLLALALYSYEVVNQYARDASRYAMVHGAGCSSPLTNPATSCSIGIGDNYYVPAKGNEVPGTAPADSGLLTFLGSEIYPGINGTKLTVTTSYAKAPGEGVCSNSNCNAAGDQVTVTVSYPYLYAIPFLPSRSFTMTASSTMTISQ